MTEFDKTETIVQGITPSVPLTDSIDSESSTKIKVPTSSLEEIACEKSVIRRPSTEKEIKTYVLQTLPKIKKRFRGEYHSMMAVYYNLDQHTYVFTGMDNDGAHQAIKVWTPAPWFTKLESTIKQQKFYDEIDLISGMYQLMRGKNVVRVTGIGTKKREGDSPIIYFTTNYVERLLSNIHPAAVQPKKLISIHRQVAGFLSFLHRNYGIIHKDVKPGNILINNDDEAFLIDFGSMEGMHIENRVAEIGTIPYLSPAQAEGMLNIDAGKTALALDYSTDMYSLGTTLADIIFKNHPENKLAAQADFYKERNDPDGFCRRLAWGPEITFPSTGNNALDEFIYKSRTQTDNKYESMEEAENALSSIEANL
ncbi:protein kinase [Candidatus Woesearchaeota archaeon]|nr:protein kinase [Candidatus Woesearchaeota archaeon]